VTADPPGGIALDPPRALGALVTELGGNAAAAARDTILERIVPPQRGSSPRDLVVVVSGRSVREASACEGVLLCDTRVAPRLAAKRRWTHEHVWWVVAQLVPARAERTDLGSGWVHPAAAVDATAELAVGSVVHAGAVVGARSRIGEHAVIYDGVWIGADVTIGAHAVIGHPGFGWASDPFGHRFRIPQRGGVVIEDGAEIGPLSTVDAGTLGPTRIGKGTKLDAHVHVGHNAVVGERVLAAAQVGIAGSVKIGNEVLVGGQAGFADHVSVGSRARVAAKSGVIGDIPSGAVVAGFPAVPRMQWLRSMASLLRKR
jgi:UDP-3-O-[3-hydroxymyristoyl] glucosamine N-acyltransferase